MDPEHWQRVKKLYHAALERQEGQRTAYVEEASCGDPALRDEVQSLLAYDERGESFLEAPALELAAQALAEEEAESHPPPPVLPSLIGQTISHYHVLEKLGGGGMGVVYKAEDTRLNRFVALKFLPDELEKHSEAFERLRREAQAASALNHPNICTIYDIGEADGQPFIAMELLEGTSLEHRISGKPLEAATLIDLAIQVSGALEAAHAKGVVHCDIKSENIFITPLGQAKILDFGIARTLLARRPTQTGQGAGEAAREPSKAAQTVGGLVRGTVSYMSPEQARGEALDSRTDLFSFGVVLFEMATGTLPFPGRSSPEILAALLREPPCSALELNPKLPAELEGVITKALEKDCERRYQGATEMRADLLRLKVGTRTERADVAPPIMVPALTERLHSTWGRWAGAIATFFILAGVVAFLLRPPLPPPRITGYKQLTHDGRHKDVLATDGPRVYFSESLPQSPEHTPRTSLASVSTLGGETVLLPTPLQAPFVEDISPDGTELLVTDRSAGTLEHPFYVVRTVDGFTRRLGDVMGHCGYWMACGGWLADGRIIYADGKDLGLVKRDGSGAHRFATAPDVAWWPRSSPDGRLIRFHSPRFPPQISEVGADGGNLHQLLPEWKVPACCGSWTPDGNYFVFMASSNNGYQLWAMREHGDLLHKVNHRPVQLTSGPAPVTLSIPSRDGKKLLGIRHLGRSGEVWRYDATTRKLLLRPERIPALYVDLSRDGSHLVYVSDDQTLWTSKPDGSGPLQLTFPPLTAFEPRFSPDSKQIAFWGTGPGEVRQNVYLVSTLGGKPEPLLPLDRSSTAPDWSPDGRKLAFISVGTQDMDLRVVDIATRQVSVVPSTQKLLDPFWSPDGRYLVAMIPEIRTLMLFDFTNQNWSVLEKRPASNPRWSPDSKSVYFSWSENDKAGISRVRLSDHKVDLIVNLDELKLAPRDAWGFALEPDQSILVTVTRRTDEIFALDWDAP